MKEMSKIDGFSSEYVFLPKNEVSGDFLVTQKMPDGRTFIFLGDVTGHGFYSGAYASAMISAIRSYFDTCSMFGANLNQFAMYIARAAFYYHGGSEQSSCECVICEIDPSRNVANFVTFSGGNISPIIIKKSGKVKTVYSLLEDDSEESRTKNDETMKKITPRLGEPYYENNITFETMPGVFTERFCVGDTILFYTDGFSEMFSQVKKGLKDQAYVYGVDNMERAVKDAVSTKGNDPDVVVNAVISDISSYAVKGLSDSKRLENLIYDDATMFCIKREI
jgi:serine phosphatase RsbU (regulator of sigma subunit)